MVYFKIKYKTKDKNKESFSLKYYGPEKEFHAVAHDFIKAYS